MNIKKFSLGLAAFLLAFAGALYVHAEYAASPQPDLGGAIATLSQAESLAAGSPVKHVKLGAVSSPEIPSPYITVGGVTQYFGKEATFTASTTQCAIQAPSSTSTVMYAALQTTVGTSTSLTWTAATSTTAFATTTNLVPNFTVPSGTYASMIAASTTFANTVISPNNWVVWSVAGVATGAVPSINFGGSCTAEFRVL